MPFDLLSIDLEELDVKNKVRVRRDGTTSTTRTITQCRRDFQKCTLAEAHLEDALVPTLDHLQKNALEKMLS